MKNKEYWKKRIVEDTQNRFDTHNDIMQEELKKIYKNMSDKMAKEVDDIYFKLLEDSITRTDIWTYKHYRDLSKRLAVLAAKVGLKEEELLNVQLEIALKEIYKETPLPKPISFTTIDEVTVKRLIATKWTDKHFSERVWSNKAKMIERLRKGITESIVLGKSKDAAVKDIMDKCKVGFNDADRLIRTELMTALNEGKKQRYKDSGYTHMERVACHDERLCELCESRDGEILPIDSEDAYILHPRCRDTFIPVIEWD